MHRKLIRGVFGTPGGAALRRSAELAAVLVALALLLVSVGPIVDAQETHVLILDDKGPSSGDEVDSFDTLSGEFEGASVTLPSSNRRTLIAAGDEAAVLIPANDQLGTDWTTPGFNDAGWTSGPTGVGYMIEE